MRELVSELKVLLAFEVFVFITVYVATAAYCVAKNSHKSSPNVAVYVNDKKVSP